VNAVPEGELNVLAGLAPSNTSARTMLAVTNKDVIQNKMMSVNLRLILNLPFDRKTADV
jgi:hypothetical protein